MFISSSCASPVSFLPPSLSLALSLEPFESFSFFFCCIFCVSYLFALMNFIYC